MSQSVVTSLAILNVNYSAGKDFIDLFVPFVAETLRLSPVDTVSSSALQEGVLDNFGLRIPQNALKTILKRALRQRLVSAQNGVYIRNPEALSKFNLTKNASEIARKHEALLTKLSAFCKDRFALDWTNSDAELHFLAYLEDHSIPVLEAAISGLPIEKPSLHQDKFEYPIYALDLLHKY